MELVPGETLAERVAKGPVPVEEALEVCRQIAEGVEAAHEKGVIHRDLKPANVKVTPEGKVKILDFGLAKAFESEMPVTDISQSPTLTEEMTRAGVILGTAAYMSPEQARGKPVDKRADIFAFGSLFYELLTGNRAFAGETITDTIASILKSEPEWEALPPSIPSTIRFLINRCLQKDAGKRLQHIDGARILIEEALSGTTTLSPIGATIQPPLWKQAIPWSITLTIALAAVVVVWISTRPVLLSPVKFVVSASSNAPLEDSPDRNILISPDGKHIAYVGRTASITRIYLRSLTDLEAQPLSGTENLRGTPFFSSDSESLAFFANGALRKISLEGGPPVTLCIAQGGNRDSGSWFEDTIVFRASIDSGVGLYRVSANGGEPELLLIPDASQDELGFISPEILPGGEAVLFTAQLVGEQYEIRVMLLETGEQKVLIKGGQQAHYAPTGHLVYEAAQTGTLMAIPFDPAGLEVTGDSVPVLEEVRRYRYFQ